MVWDLDNNSVPPLHAELTADYESVRKVLKAGETFCQDSDLAFSQAQSNALIRGTTKRDGQEVEYEVVARNCVHADRGCEPRRHKMRARC